MKSPRNAVVDIYRGFVMFLMMAEVWEFWKLSQKVPESGFWKFLAFNQSHVEWVGCSLHDMIQPSFSFLVGVALPFSVASRIKKGEDFKKMMFHALKRSLILILLGVFLRSFGHTITNWTFEDTLTQIGLGYPFLFFLGFASPKIQRISFAGIIFFYWLAFALYPIASPDFNWETVGVANDWPHFLSGFAAHWNKNYNLANAFDQWFLNLFPRNSPFVFNGGGYVTLSFIPTLGTMILGLFAGNILKSEPAFSEKIRTFVIYSISLIFIGLFVHFLGVNPIVKRIWTPAWTLFSGGICFLFLILFSFLVEKFRIVKPFEFFRIIGLNSIAAYVLAHTVNGFIYDNFKIHFGQNIYMIFGENYETLVSGTAILAVEWLILRWMYRNQVFIKI
ncbi:MAG: DUF5009 domain-containing protein [Spirosomataceae bacterium]|jgi:predicted acyltransferase